MNNLAEDILDEFVERAFPPTRRNDGRYVERPRHSFPIGDIVEASPEAFEVHREVWARITRRRIARRRVLWIPTGV